MYILTFLYGDTPLFVLRNLIEMRWRVNYYYAEDLVGTYHILTYCS